MKPIYILFLFTISATQVFCTDYYWVNNSGNWSDHNNHWATTSGGSVFHSSAPSSSDNVIFDQNSFAQPTDILVIDADASCNSFIFNRNKIIVYAVAVRCHYIWHFKYRFTICYSDCNTIRNGTLTVGGLQPVISSCCNSNLVCCRTI